MNNIETNIFSIRNLGSLNFEYDTYAVRNLKRGQAEYFQNKDHLVRTLSFKLGAPVQAIERSGDPFLAIPSNAGPVPERLSLVRTNVVLERIRERLKILIAGLCNEIGASDGALKVAGALSDFVEGVTGERASNVDARDVLDKRLGIPNLDRVDFFARTRTNWSTDSNNGIGIRPLRLGHDGI